MLWLPIVLGLVKQIVDNGPQLIEAGVNGWNLLTGAREAMNRVVEHSPEAASDADFMALDAQLKSLEDELQRIAASRVPPAAG